MIIVVESASHKIDILGAGIVTSGSDPNPGRFVRIEKPEVKYAHDLARESGFNQSAIASADNEERATRRMVVDSLWVT
jgi:hypothetical protein